MIVPSPLAELSTTQPLYVLPQPSNSFFYNGANIIAHYYRMGALPNGHLPTLTVTHVVHACV